MASITRLTFDGADAVGHQRTVSCFVGMVLSISIRTGRIPAYQRALDHCQSSATATNPVTG